MNLIAYRAQPTTANAQSRLLLALGALLFSLLLPTGAFAEEPTSPAVAPAAQAAVPTPAVAPIPANATEGTPVAETPAAAALREQLAALGPNATPEQIQAVTAQAGIEASTTDDQGLAHDLSPWGMYQNADIIVKIVMIGLALASVITWTIWLAKGFELLGAKRRLRQEIVTLKRARSLKEAGENASTAGSLSHLLVQDALEEMRLSANSREREGIKERVSFRLERLVAASGRQMSQGTGVLATIGSTAPFVGLFGTVWGIMNSFIGIAKSQTTNLAVVAPGIAEALLATALGLVAAIPAVVIYNVFARSIAGYKAQVTDASAQVLLLVSRDLDHLPAERSPLHMAKVG